MTPNFAQTQQQYFALKGGLDLLTPALSIDPGKAFDAENYEPVVNGGYARINGYERYDGRTSPTDADYWVLGVTITGTIAVGNTVTGLASGATGKVLKVNAAQLVLGRVTGTWQNGEAVQVSAVTQATTTGLASINGATTVSDHADYKLLSANDWRTDIQAITGSGAVRGVWIYKDTLYAFRDNAGGTAGAMWKATGSGWSAVSLGTEVAFTAGGGATPAEGATLTQGGVTATIRRVVRRTGAWTGSAVGVFVITGVAGGNFAAGAATATGGVTCTLSGIQTAITLPAGGNYEFVNYNFTGSADTLRMYGCNDVGTAFEFDGTYFVPIRTGMTTDTPSHITAHKNHLFLSFRASLQNSSITDPYAWTPVTGASEIGTGDVITAMLPQTGDASSGAMAVYTIDKTFILYGTSASDWKLTVTNPEAGGTASTAQNIGVAFTMSKRGIMALSPSDTYGDFQFNSITQLIQPLIDAKQGLATASTVLKERNQYRVFFSDGTGLVITMAGNKPVGTMPIRYNDVVRCYCSATLSNGKERAYFGSDDGYVYRDNVGTSFDGDPISAWVRLAFDHIGAPRIRKKFKRSVFELSVDEMAQVSVSYELGYGTPDVAAGTLSMVGAGGYWDQFTWDQFTWDAQSIADASIDITGTEKNISLLFYSNRAQDKGHTLQGVIFHYIPRRLER